MGKFRDLTGCKFGRLTVLSRAESKIRSNGKPRTRWECVCECGAKVVVNSDALTRGYQVSCGCLHKEIVAKNRLTHGMSGSKLYGVWGAMKNRCYNKNVYEYRFYGERGITVCNEWKADFKSFYKWAVLNGYKETASRGECTIDRIDPNKGYYPENCRIISQLEQMNNLRSNHLLTCNGVTHTIAEWSRITGINQFKIRNRVSRLGWSVERALQTI